MEIKKFDRETISLGFFSMLLIIFLFLILSKSVETTIIKEDSITTNLQVILTPKHIIIENPYSDTVPYKAISDSNNESSSKLTLVKLFPLKLLRRVEVFNETISLDKWYFKIHGVSHINYTEFRGRNITQGIRIVDLRFKLESELSDSNFILKTVFETEEPRGQDGNEKFNGSLRPMTGQLYGGFYLPLGENINILIEWEPADKPIAVIVYHGSGRVEGYLLREGSWSGSLKGIDVGLNCIIIGNTDRNQMITYSTVVFNP